MKRRITARVDADPASTMTALADLGTYPDWLPVVAHAEPEGNDSPREEAWTITLRAKLGPLARSKRLRMVRTELTADRVRFERAEVDGRNHADWTLQAQVGPSDPAGSDVTVDLAYSGSLWSAPLEGVLSGFETSAATALSDYLTKTA